MAAPVEAPVEEPESVIVAEVVEEPVPETNSARARLAFGAFSDLHNVRPSRTPTAAPAPEPPAVAAVATPAEPTTSHPEFAVPTAERQAAFAEVAEAVGAIAQAPAAPAVEPPATTWSEDFIPQHLPKRGRRSSRLQTPWVRGRSNAASPEAGPDAEASVNVPASSAPFAAAGSAPLGPPSAPAPLVNEAGAVSGVSPAPPSGEPGAMRFGPELPTRQPGRATGETEPSTFAHGTNGDGSDPGQPAAAAAPAANGSDERFAFFAAFRAAAERAREEAGIDTRRNGR